MARCKLQIIFGLFALILVAFPGLSEPKNCKDLLNSDGTLKSSDEKDAEKIQFNSALAEFLCNDDMSNEDEDDDQDVEDELEEHKRVKRSPFWGGSSSRGSRGSTSRSSSRSSSSRRSGFWGGGSRTSTSSGSRTSSKRTGGFWGGSSSSTKSSTKPKAKTSSTWDKVHTALDVAGMLPGVGAIPDAINTGLHAARGNWKQAGQSAAAMVPGVGQAVTGSKLAAKAVSRIDRISDAAKVTRSFAKKKGTETVKQSQTSVKAMRGLFEKATGKTHSGGVSVGKTADGRTLTFRDKSKTGPATLDINKNGDITKIRCKDCKRPK